MEGIRAVAVVATAARCAQLPRDPQVPLLSVSTQSHPSDRRFFEKNFRIENPDFPPFSGCDSCSAATFTKPSGPLGEPYRDSCCLRQNNGLERHASKFTDFAEKQSPESDFFRKKADEKDTTNGDKPEDESVEGEARGRNDNGGPESKQLNNT